MLSLFDSVIVMDNGRMKGFTCHCLVEYGEGVDEGRDLGVRAAVPLG